MNKETYVLIKVGYEGIEGLIYLTKSKTLITKKVIKIREDIIKFKNTAIEKVGSDSSIDIDEAYFGGKISSKEYLAISDNQEQYCVQQWNGKEFKCCCNELGLANEKTWYY